MGLSGARATDEYGIALGVQEYAGGQFANLTLVDRRVGEHELIEVLEHRELGAADAIAD
jgi:hypothetical protein